MFAIPYKLLHMLNVSDSLSELSYVFVTEVKLLNLEAKQF